MNIKKILLGVGAVLVALILALVIFIVFFAQPATTTADAVALNDGVLTVGVPADASQYGIVWAETDIAQRVGEILGVQVELVTMADEYDQPTTRAQRLDALNTGAVDLLLAQIGWDTDFSGNYLTSSIYAKAGLYLGNPLGSYVDTLAVLDGATLFVGDLVPEQVVGEVPATTNINRSTMQTSQDLLLELSIAAYASREEYYLFTEEQALIYSTGSDLIHIMPLLDSPELQYVAVANLGETAIISACNQAISEYLDAQLTPSEDGETTEG